MMTEQQQIGEEAFQANLCHLFEQLDPNDALFKGRSKAWDHFLELGLPSRRDEVYRYVRLKRWYVNNYVQAKQADLSKEALIPYILPECQKSYLVFVNGFFIPTLSSLEALPKQTTATSIPEALRTYSGFLNSHWMKTLKEETDPLAALNMALHSDGLFLYIPPKTILNTPIQLLNLIDAPSDPMLIMPRIQAFIGSQAQLNLISTQATLSGKQYAINFGADLVLEEDAHVNYSQIIWDGNEEIWHFDALRAILKRNSTLKTVSVTNGAAAVRCDYRIRLLGENAEALLNGVWMLEGKNEAHTHVLIDHQAPFCRSMQLFKGALNGSSHSSFEGKILVRQRAQKTEAFQLNNNLLLSDRAIADSKPNLEIFADDVKASHGATVGQLDKEQIFYMKTRGFTEEQAKNLLTRGFCQEVIDLIPIDSVRKNMQKQAAGFLLA